jgi:TATA-binding protein-associated factor Taf7
MAKTTKTGLADDLNAEGSAEDGLSVDDLNAGDSTQENSMSKTDDAESSVDDDGAEEKPKTLNRRSMWC